MSASYIDVYSCVPRVSGQFCAQIPFKECNETHGECAWYHTSKAADSATALQECNQLRSAAGAPCTAERMTGFGKDGGSVTYYVCNCGP